MACASSRRTSLTRAVRSRTFGAPLQETHMLSRREALAIPAACCLCGSPLIRFARAADEDPTKVFTGDKKPTDYRLGAPKDLNGYFPFEVPKTKEAWETRRTQLREQLLVA